MVFEKLKEILIEEFEVEEEWVTPDAVLLKDLDMDSIDLVDLVMSLEDEFSLELSDEALEGIKTVEQLVKYIEENK
jgi:acyl carrier protein